MPTTSYILWRSRINQDWSFCCHVISYTSLLVILMILTFDLSKLHSWRKSDEVSLLNIWTFSLFSVSYNSDRTNRQQTDRQTERRTDGRTDKRRERESSKRPLSLRALRRIKKLQIVNRKKSSSWVAVQEPVRQQHRNENTTNRISRHTHEHTRARVKRPSKGAIMWRLSHMSSLAVMGKLHRKWLVTVAVGV